MPAILKFSANFDLIAAASSLGQAMHDEHFWPDAHRELRQVVDWVADDCANQGVDAIECRFYVGAHASSDFVREAARAILSQMEQQKQASLRLALGLPRQNPGPLWEVAKALRTQFSALSAIDFCYVEEGFPPKQLQSFFREVTQWNQLNPRHSLTIWITSPRAFATNRWQVRFAGWIARRSLGFTASGTRLHSGLRLKTGRFRYRRS